MNLKIKKMLPLTKKELKSHQDVKVSIVKIIEKSEISHYTGKYRGATHSICNLKFNVSNEIYVVFHRGSNYDYHFIIKELANLTI